MSFGSDNNANKFKKTYINDFLDVSGNIISRNTIKTDKLTSFNNKLYIGTDSSCSDIYIGNSSTNIFLDGNTTQVNTNNLEVEDYLIKINKSGVNCSGSGIEIEENNIIEASIKLSDDKNNFKIKYPYDNLTYDIISRKNLEQNISNIDSHIIQSGGCEDDYNISQNLLVGNRITAPNIYCNNLFTNQNFNQLSALIICNNNFQIPLYKSLLDSSTNIYTNLNFNSLILNTTIKLYLYPYIKIRFIINEGTEYKLFINTKNDLYYNEYFVNTNIVSIFIYYKNCFLI